jgi:hypothetical protein
MQGKTVYHHILMWEMTNGPLPEDMEVDHLCFNRNCIELTHLEAVTSRENQVRRAQHNKKNRFIGIAKHGSNWRARIHLRSGKVFNIGTYATQEEAARAYDYIARSEFGADTTTNESLGNFK